jgi:arginase
MQDIKLLGIPFDFGQDHSGVRQAYQYLKDAGIVQRLTKLTHVKDLGNLYLQPKKESEIRDNIKSSRQASVSNYQISECISLEKLDDSFLLNVGGDHGMALGTIHGILSHRPETIVIWADAHGDINTPEISPSGNFHGMPLAFLLKVAKHPDFDWIKRALLPQKLILIGPRDLDEGEKDLIQRLSIQYFSSEELNRIGVKEVLEIALHRADPMGLSPIHLSFDVDLFDGLDIPSTGTTVSGGPKLEEVFLLGGILGETGRLRSMDLVEFNPLIGTDKEAKASGDLVMDFLEMTLMQVFASTVASARESKSFFSKALNKNLFQSENP